MPSAAPSDASGGPRAEERRSRQRGTFLVFEGPEGAGKSTQVRELARRLEAEGETPLCTREPGGTPAGDAMRAILLDDDLRIDALAEFLLLSASRAQHVTEVIEPALAAGRIVISDRFSAASVAYQGYGRGLDLAFVASLNARSAAGIEPDLTILLDLDPVDGLARAASRGAHDRLEQAGLAFHQRVRAGFLAQAEGRSDWLVLDAGLPNEAVAERVWEAVRGRLERTGRSP